MPTCTEASVSLGKAVLSDAPGTFLKCITLRTTDSFIAGKHYRTTGTMSEVTGLSALCLPEFVLNVYCFRY